MSFVPEMRELLRALDRDGVPYRTHIEENVREDGLRSFLQQVVVLDEIRVSLGWSIDADEQKRFDTLGGKFGYIEMTRDDVSMMVTADEVMEAVAEAVREIPDE